MHFFKRDVHLHSHVATYRTWSARAPWAKKIYQIAKSIGTPPRVNVFKIKNVGFFLPLLYHNPDQSFCSLTSEKLV